MSAALGVVALYFGSFIEVLDISIAVIASLLTTLTVIEYGKSAPWSVYATTAILSLILLPQKLPALMYTLFFGYYPIIKEKIERLSSRVAQWTIKLCIFAAATAILLVISTVFTAELDLSAGTVIAVVYTALAALTFILYDIALTRMISFYFFRLRDKFKKLFYWYSKRFKASNIMDAK
jgi:hypothetical protein